MFNISSLKTELADLIGFRSQEGFNLPSTLTTSTSGVIVQDNHPLLSLTVLNNVRPENYDLIGFLSNMRDNAIIKTMNDVITHKNLNKVTKEVLSETRIFDSTASFRNTESKKGRFVGWVIRPSKIAYLNHLIKRVGLQFLEADTIELYLYHSSMTTPLRTVTLNYTTPRSVQWVELDPHITLNYKDEDAGGFYYIGYYEDDLAPSNVAIYKEHDLSKRPCGGCNPFNHKAYSQFSSYFSINTAIVNDPVMGEMNDVRDLQFVNTRNYGLNFGISSVCDITDFLLEYKNLLVYPILYRLSIDLLRYVEMSPTRNNVVTDTMSKESFIAINGQISENNHIKVRGLIHDYEDKIKALDFNLSRLEPVCMPCETKGIRWNKNVTNIY